MDLIKIIENEIDCRKSCLKKYHEQIIKNIENDKIISHDMAHNFKQNYQSEYERMQYEEILNRLKSCEQTFDCQLNLLYDYIEYYTTELTNCQLFRSSTDIIFNVCSMFQSESKQRILNRLECLKNSLVRLNESH